MCECASVRVCECASVRVCECGIPGSNVTSLERYTELVRLKETRGTVTRTLSIYWLGNLLSFAAHHWKPVCFCLCSCYSTVGRQGGRQDISIGNGCERKGTILHEMMHTIGFIHEQSRPDRDKYVNVFYDNIKPGEISNSSYQSTSFFVFFNSPLFPTAH